MTGSVTGTYVWRRLDLDGATFVRVHEDAGGVRIDGAEVCSEAGVRWLARFAIELDPGWHHRTTLVEVDDGEGTRQRRIDDLDGCDTLDLAGNPFTNALVLHRNDLPVGGAVEVVAAYVETPSLDVRPLRQRYRRIDDRTWEYADETGAFWLTVDEGGVTVDYEDLAVRA